MGVATNGILSLLSVTGKTTAAVLLVTLSWRPPLCYVELLMLFFNRSLVVRSSARFLIQHMTRYSVCMWLPWSSVFGMLKKVH